MTSAIALIIGGILPAVLFGVSSIFVKSSNQIGIGLGPYLMVVGVAVFLLGLSVAGVTSDYTVSQSSAIHGFLSGFLWAMGTGLVAYTLVRYETPIAKLVPLYNMNTLVAVGLALWIFAEWKQVDAVQLLIGAVLIVVGGTLVAKA